MKSDVFPEKNQWSLPCPKGITSAMFPIHIIISKGTEIDAISVAVTMLLFYANQHMAYSLLDEK